MVNDIQNKIIIIGGGLIGELLHMMLKSKGFEINHFTKDSNVKNRTFALSPSSVDWLRSLGLPSIFFESLSEIKSMKIFDSSIKNSVTLNADDAQKPALAYIANESDFDEGEEIDITAEDDIIESKFVESSESVPFENLEEIEIMNRALGDMPAVSTSVVPFDIFFTYNKLFAHQSFTYLLSLIYHSK